MPHAELRYSDDLDVDAHAILARIEAIILAHDPASGACKGRAYPAAVYHHRHFYLGITMLQKLHRDAAFTDALMRDLEEQVKAMITVPCAFSFALDYSAGAYVTNMHEGAQ